MLAQGNWARTRLLCVGCNHCLIAGKVQNARYLVAGVMDGGGDVDDFERHIFTHARLRKRARVHLQCSSPTKTLFKFCSPIINTLGHLLDLTYIQRSVALKQSSARAQVLQGLVKRNSMTTADLSSAGNRTSGK
jgi:hypothetical protein